MIGLEPAEPSIQVAKQHAARDPILRDRLTYECTTVEEYVGRTDLQQVDLVVASEVVEHVANPPLFTHNICKLIKVHIRALKNRSVVYVCGCVHVQCDGGCQEEAGPLPAVALHVGRCLCSQLAEWHGRKWSLCFNIV